MDLLHETALCLLFIPLPIPLPERRAFGFGRNVFAQFPEEGYSDLVGNEIAPGHTYRAAFSADWPEERKLRIRVQIIDKYFANLAIVFGFRDGKNVSVRMTKQAENFLNEYNGILTASAESDEGETDDAQLSC